MPFRSEKQRAYLWKYHPDIAKKWDAEHGEKIVPSEKKEEKDKESNK